MKKVHPAKNSIINNLIYFLIASSGLFLLLNRFPYLGIASFVILFLLGLIFIFIKRSVTTYHAEILGLLSIIYIYLILSYFISGQTLSNFFSFSFLRYDGNFFFAYMPFFVLAIDFFDYEKVTRIYTMILFSVFSIFSIIAIYGFMTDNPVLSMFELERDRGLMFNALNNAHNATGSVYAVVCLILLSFFLKEKRKVKYLYLLIFLLSMTGLFLTKSRGSYIGFAAGAAIILWFFFRSWKKFGIAVAAVTVTAIPAVYFSGIYSKIPDFFDLSGGTAGVRLRLWDKAWYLFEQSPLFGIGFGRYNDAGYENIRLTGLDQIAAFFIEPKFDFSSGHAHNSYFHFLAETGALGLGLLLLFWVLCYLKILRAYNLTKNDFSKKIFLAGLGIIAALFALSLTENYFSATTVMMCVSVFISLSLGLFWQEERVVKT
jgi:O-antigen ligase